MKEDDPPLGDEWDGELVLLLPCTPLEGRWWLTRCLVVPVRGLEVEVPWWGEVGVRGLSPPFAFRGESRGGSALRFFRGPAGCVATRGELINLQITF